MMDEAIRSLKSAVFCIDLFMETNRAPTREQLRLIGLKVRNALAVIESEDKKPVGMSIAGWLRTRRIALRRVG